MDSLEPVTPVRIDLIIPTRIQYAEPARLMRIRGISRLLDSSIRLPGGFRIGLDPLVGLIPTAGDLIMTAISWYLVYEAARLGIPKRTLFRMGGNVLLDSTFGSIPLLGDLFDAVWKSNTRNVALLEQVYHPTMPERPAGRIFVAFAVSLVAILAGVIALGIWMLRWIYSAFNP